MLWHKKTSTAPETEDPDLVGSQHWNDVHGYGAGAFFPVLVGEFGFTPPSAMGLSVEGPCVAGLSPTNPFPGTFEIPIASLPSTLKAQTSLEVSYLAFLTGFGSMPSTGWQWSISMSGDDISGWKIVLRHGGPDSELANPTIEARLFFTLYATVSEPI